MPTNLKWSLPGILAELLWQIHFPFFKSTSLCLFISPKTSHFHPYHFSFLNGDPVLYITEKGHANREKCIPIFLLPLLLKWKNWHFFINVQALYLCSPPHSPWPSLRTILLLFPILPSAAVLKVWSANLRSLRLIILFFPQSSLTLTSAGS